MLERIFAFGTLKRGLALHKLDGMPVSSASSARMSRFRLIAEPQIAQQVTLMIASRGCLALGSGTIPQRISALPRQQSALMSCLSILD